MLVAHSIRGSAANVGGNRVRDLAAALQEQGESAILDAAAQSLPQLRAAMKSLATVIHQFCNRND
jgi:HPt (histidine-containing phosphotransfer) domain-containing protein